MSALLCRRSFTRGVFLVAGSGLLLPAAAQKAARGSSRPQNTQFGFDDVVERARDLSAIPFQGDGRRLPSELDRLDYDTYREIRFRSEKALFREVDGTFQMQLFHPGFIFKRPITINVIRDGVAPPILYSSSMFDYGSNHFVNHLPIDLGFAGLKLTYPLNELHKQDEVISFLGASYFRFLARKQRYGLSARALAISTGTQEPEEFPFFREFWVEQPKPRAQHVQIYALLDSVSVTGAYRFKVSPGPETTIDVEATLYARRPLRHFGLAPFTSMFFTGENDRKPTADFRPELHDSDGLLMCSGTGEWLWRPLLNPTTPRISNFLDSTPRGFGLMQRDRLFAHYEDLEAAYHLRPSYWVEPRGDWGAGSVELVELATPDETNDNIVAYWRPSAVLEAGQKLTVQYLLRAVMANPPLHSLGYVVNTFQSEAKSAGWRHPVDTGTHRFILDFAGGDLPYFIDTPESVEVDVKVSTGQVKRTFLVADPEVSGFRAGVDVGQGTDVRVFLRSGERQLTETWTMPWQDRTAVAATRAP